eukprot:1010173-Amphidinium_carterae.1
MQEIVSGEVESVIQLGTASVIRDMKKSIMEKIESTRVWRPSAEASGESWLQKLGVQTPCCKLPGA